MAAEPRATLVVTRPRDDAHQLVALLTAQGHDVIAFPVLGIEPVVDIGAVADAIGDVERYALVVFVSPNAIRHALAHRSRPWPHDVAIGVMGPGSVAALDGFDVIGPQVRVVTPGSGAPLDDAVRFDSEALLAALEREHPEALAARRPVLIVKGNGGRPWLAERLRERGVQVDTVESYQRVRPAPDPDAARRLRERCAARLPVSFIVTSSEGLGSLVDLVADAIEPDVVDPRARERVRAWILASVIHAPHARIVEEARRLGFSGVVLTPPGDAGIAAAIR